MSREPQGEKSKGSQKWIQVLVNECCEVIDQRLAESHGLKQVCWLSPLKEDDYSEYRDSRFIDRLNVNLNVSLESFWPKTGGPRWDALAKTAQGEIIIVEAKSHIKEMVSDPSYAGRESLEKILESFEEVKYFLGIRSNSTRKYVDWSKYFYQYTNRLAHLYFFRECNKLPAYLLFIYFMNDRDMLKPGTECPGTQSEWKCAINLLESFLGIRPRHKLSKYVLNEFIDVGELIKQR